MQTRRETKFGSISLGNVMVVKAKNGHTSLMWVESLEPDQQFRDEINALGYAPSQDGVSLGDTNWSHENVVDFENRIDKLEVVAQLTTREEWTRFVETCRHIIILNRIKKAGFEFHKNQNN